MTENRKAVYNPEADKKWRENNKDRSNYLRYRSSSRNFIKNHATIEDIKELESLIAARKEVLKKWII